MALGGIRFPRMADSTTGAGPALHAKACGFVVVEDDPLLCTILANTLRREFAPASLHAFRTGREALKHCLKHGVDVLLTDLGLPDIDGREIIRQVRSRGRKPHTVVLTGRTDPRLPGELIALGVAGFVDKSAPLEHVISAVRRVLAGGMYFFANVVPANSATATMPKAGPEVSVLTEREREIAALVSGGLSSKEIASRLGLSVRTVENHRAHLMQKLGVNDVPGLVRWCIQNGLG